MFEKEAEEYSNNWKINKNSDLNFAELVELRAVIYKANKDGAEYGYNKAKEEDKWHYVKDGDLPKDKETVLALCIVGGKPYPYLAQYWKDNTKREKDGVDLNWICWRNNLQREVVEPYAWKEIVLPKED